MRLTYANSIFFSWSSSLKMLYKFSCSVKIWLPSSKFEVSHHVHSR